MGVITYFESDYLFYLARDLVKLSREVKENPSPNKSSGVLTILDINTNEFLKGKSDFYLCGEIFPISNMSSEKIEKDVYSSQEGAHRLYAHWLRDPKNVFSSYQSRDPTKGMLGGAVIDVKNSIRIYSFTGLAEKVNEAIALTLSQVKNNFEGELIKKVVNFSENEIYYPLFEKYKDFYKKQNMKIIK